MRPNLNLKFTLYFLLFAMISLILSPSLFESLYLPVFRTYSIALSFSHVIDVMSSP